MKFSCEKLKKLREDNGFTQKQVADYLGIDQSYFSKMEKGQRKINLVTLDKICLLYNCSSDYLLGESDDYEKPKITFHADEKVDLFAIAKMNQIIKYLKLLRCIKEDINHE